MLSVLINTKNEAHNIEQCINSILGYASEVVVIDMQSTDNTCEKARKLGAKVFIVEDCGYVEPARKFGVDMCTGKWILILDADERLTKTLGEEIIRVIKINTGDAFWIPRQNHIFNHVMKFTGWGPQQDKQLRLFKRGFITHTDKIHSQPEIKNGAIVGFLSKESDCHLIHYNYTSRTEFIDRMNRYTSIQTKQMWGARTIPIPLSRCIYEMCKEFLVRYIYLRGFRDGATGLELSYLMSVYKYLLCVKFNDYLNEKKSII